MTKLEWLFKKLNKVEKKIQKDSLFRETHQDVYYTDKKYFELLDEQRIIKEIIEDESRLYDMAIEDTLKGWGHY